jgi:hypothetical protein
MADEEVFPLFGEIELALNKLPGWMKDEGRIWDASLFFKVMSTYIIGTLLMEGPKVMRQPKGVSLVSSSNLPEVRADV